MAGDKENRRSFLRRITMMGIGAGVGGAIASVSDPEPEALPVVRQPFATPVPGEDGQPAKKPRFVEEMEEQARREQEEGHKPDRQFPGMSEEGERIAKGAVVGAVVGAGVSQLHKAYPNNSGEAGATQNDPKRVEWERWQQRHRDREERERNRNRDNEV